MEYESIFKRIKKDKIAQLDLITNLLEYKNMQFERETSNDLKRIYHIEANWLTEILTAIETGDFKGVAFDE